MNQEKIGKFIAKCRKEKNMTQKELATKLDVTDKAISKWETGRCLPDLSLVQNLSKTLGITINELLTGEKINEPEYEEKFEENIVNTIEYTNTKIKKNKKLLIIILIMFYMVAGYFCYKIVNYNKYNLPTVSTFDVPISKILFNDKNVITNVMTKMYDEDILTFKNLSMKNKFKDFYYYQIGEDTIVYSLYDENNEFISSLSISNKKSNIDEFPIYQESEELKSLTKEFLIKHNINNDIDAIKYLKNMKELKTNIFTSVKRMKENYIIRNLYYSLFPTSVDKIELIDNGYMYNFDESNKKAVNIISGDKVYRLQFENKEYFTDEYIKELIDTIVIN